MPVWRDVGAVVFVDGGNVFAGASPTSICGELRGSVGFGVRYRSPIGPIRVDLGFKLDRRGGRTAHSASLQLRTGLLTRVS